MRFEATLTKEQRKKVEELILAGYGNEEIKRRVGVSNFPIYEIKYKLGIYYKKVGRRDEVHNNNGVMNSFECKGVGNCGWCKHQFQYPCPMDLEEKHFEYKREKVPMLFDVESFNRGMRELRNAEKVTVSEIGKDDLSR